MTPNLTRTTRVWLSAIAGVIATLPVLGAEPALGKLEFNRDIRPILSENCFVCHGPDKNNRKAKLRLDDRAVALEKKAIVPGRPAESELVSRINNPSLDDVMPPPDTHKSLTAGQKELLTRWIAEGAEYQPHWSYIVPVRPRVPAVASSPNFRIRNPIDNFILEKLVSKGIRPSPEADPGTLLRRVSLDLTGLPPTPDAVRSFERDGSSRAYERAVDRLLASPHYGERMAVAWLDVVRFADTVGYHGDQNQNIFPYRDYVIDSFNRNTPFDQFTIEQIAGDLLPHPTTAQRIATGFNRLNMVTREGGAQPKEYLAKYGADRVRTIATTWLGSTMGCCECHDHKFDPFSARDFYQMEAFFADIKQWGVYNDYAYTPNPDLKGWSNDHPFPPEIEVDSPFLQRRQARLQAQIGDLQAGAAHDFQKAGPSRDAFTRWIADQGAFVRVNPSGWIDPTVSAPLPNHNETITPQGTVLISGVDPKDEDHFIHVALPAGPVAALRIELLPHAAHKGSIARGGGKTVTVQFTANYRPAGGTQSRVRFFSADATAKAVVYANGAELIGLRDTWKTDPRQATNAQAAIYILEQPIVARAGDRLVLSFKSASMGHLRISLSPFATGSPADPAFPGGIVAALKSPASRRSLADRNLLRDTYLLSTAWDTNTLAEVRKLQHDLIDCRNGRTPTVVTEAWKPTISRVLTRGNWQDETGDIVDPAPPHFLPQPRPSSSGLLSRLDLARWIVAADNPLTARTFANRTWKQFFGTGLSAVVDDLGAQGEWPTHPELLDWLAVEFRQSGWNVKRLVKLIVLSSTYRQDSNLRPELRDLDPNNRLLASQNPRRLEAEFVRDNALFVAGLLNLELGGPSVRPYQPAGYYANLQFPDREYAAQRNDQQYRRGVYMHWQRTFLHPMLANFDAPSREECTANRTVSNTPQQALTLLNDPTFVEAARALAGEILARPGVNDRARLATAFTLALARPPKPAEASSLEIFLAGQRAYFRTNESEAEKLLKTGLAPTPAGLNPSELAAWTSVSRVILNLHESVTRY